MEKPPARGIPELHGFVVASGKDACPVGRDRNGCELVCVAEGLDNAPSCGVPKLRRVVGPPRVELSPGAGQNTRAVRRKGDCGNGADVAFEREQPAALDRIPDDNGVVETGGRDALAAYRLPRLRGDGPCAIQIDVESALAPRLRGDGPLLKAGVIWLTVAPPPTRGPVPLAAPAKRTCGRQEIKRRSA